MISVCIATYNGEKYLRQQIDSILPQIGKDDEIVVSDDGSTDGTLELLLSYHDARIRILHHNPSAISTTFPLDRPTHNFENALLSARGDIIFLADQDDVWLEGKVETMLAELQDAELAVHDCEVVDDRMENIIQPSYFDFIGIHQGVWQNWVRATYLGCCMAMRKEVVRRAMPFPETMVGHDLWLGIIADRYFRTKIVRRKLIRYRKHSDSKTTSGGKSKNALWFKIRYRMTILKHIMKLYLVPRQMPTKRRGELLYTI